MPSMKLSLPQNVTEELCEIFHAPKLPWRSCPNKFNEFHSIMDNSKLLSKQSWKNILSCTTAHTLIALSQWPIWLYINGIVNYFLFIHTPSPFWQSRKPYLVIWQHKSSAAPWSPEIELKLWEIFNETLMDVTVGLFGNIIIISVLWVFNNIVWCGWTDIVPIFESVWKLKRMFDIHPYENG